MKKFVGIVSAALVLVCLTGCSKGNELKCTGTIDGQKATAIATLDGEKITKVVMESQTEASSKEEAEQAVAMITGFGSLAPEGATISAKASGKKVITTMTLDVTKMASEDVEDNLGTSEMTKDAFVKAMEEEGLTCK